MSYEVKVFKLVTSEEILCKAERTAEGDWYLTDARTLGYQPDGKPGMMPFCQLSHNRPFILRDVAIIGEAASIDPEMEKKYLSDTSGIALM